jgi:hypothetical protein
MDIDHQGKVYLAGILLTGGKVLEGETNQYKGDNGEIYTLDTVHNTLHVSHEDKEITINNYDYNKQSLGIVLLENKDIEVSITESASTSEGDTGTKSLYFTVTLSRVLEEGETLEVSVSNTDEGTYTFTSGEQTYFDTDNDGFKQFQAFTLTNLLTYKDFQSNKSLHVRTKIKQKGATHGAGQRVA